MINRVNLIIFVAATVGGEMMLLVLGFLSAQGVFSLPVLIIFSFLGAFTPNILWFLLGRTKAVEKIISHRYANTAISIIAEAIVRVSKGSHLRAIIIAKFLVGTPVLLMMYANKTDLSFKKFMYYESVAIFLSLFFILPIGYISGLGFTYFAENLKNLYMAIGLILLIITAIVILQIWLEKTLHKSIQ